MEEFRVKVFFKNHKNAFLPFEKRYDFQNGFIHGLINDKEFYKGESDYSVSFYGGRMHPNKKGLIFKDYPLVMEVASLNKDYFQKLLQGLSDQESKPMSYRLNIVGMVPHNFQLVGAPTFEKGKQVFFTNSPVLLKDHKRKFTGKPMFITCDHDDFASILQEKQERILKSYDSKINLDGFKVQFVSVEECQKLKMKPYKRVRFSMHGQNMWATSGLISIEGSEEIKRVLYYMGIGNSTGSGFGMIRPFEQKNKINESK